MQDEGRSGCSGVGMVVMVVLGMSLVVCMSGGVGAFLWVIAMVGEGMNL